MAKKILNSISLPASKTTAAPLTMPHGTAPATPADGDVWTTSAGIYVRINGGTVGPLGTGGASGPDIFAFAANYG